MIIIIMRSMMMMMMILIVVSKARENCQQHVSVVSSLVELSTLTEFFLADEFKSENNKVDHKQQSQTQTTKLEVIEKFCPHCGSIVIISVLIIIMVVIEVPNIGELKAAPFDMRVE